jgi:hypothetical protein
MKIYLLDQQKFIKYDIELESFYHILYFKAKLLLKQYCPINKQRIY